MADGLLNIDPNDINSLMTLFGPSEEDRRRARSFGLLQAGLALLGTPKGQEMAGIGRAGLLGTSAYTGELNDLVKQRGQGITQALGAQNLLRRDKFMREFDTPTQPQGMPAPSSGYDPGVSAAFGLPYSPPAPQQAPQSLKAQLQGMGIPDSYISTAMMSADPAAAINKAILEFSQPRAVGNTLYVGNKPVGGMAQRDQVPVSFDASGTPRMTPVSGLQDYFAAGAGAEEGAKKKAASPYEIVDVPGVGKMPQSEFIRRYQAETQGPTQAPTVAPTMSAQERAIAAQDAAGVRPLPTVRTPGPATSSGGLPQYNFGVTTSPLTVDAAKAAIQTDAEARQGVNKSAIAQIDKSYETASQAATTGIPLIHEARSMLDSGKVVTGFGADFRLNFGRALSASGVKMAEDPVSNTQAFASTQARQVLTIIKSLGSGSGISDADREYAAKIVGGDIKLDEPAIRRLLDISERVQRAQLAAHNTRVDTASRVMKNTDLQNLYSVADPPSYTAPAKAAPDQGALVKNTTATVKAQQALKAGAPRDAVLKRMVEQGYSIEGL